MQDNRRYDLEPERRFERLSNARCRAYLTATSVGRVGWSSKEGQMILPVAYVLRGNTVVFRTSETGPLAELVEPQPVAFEIDDFDPSRRDAWSVCVVGRSEQAALMSTGADPDPDPVPWVSGERRLHIAITLDHVTGRLLSRA